jgi:hypothetical protein
VRDLWRRDVEEQFKAAAQELTLELPNIAAIRTDIKLLRTCYMLWEMSGFKHIPNPLDVLKLPAHYVQDLFRWHQGLKFTEDYPKRPDYLKE